MGIDIDLMLEDTVGKLSFTGKTIPINEENAFILADNNRYHYTYGGATEDYYREIEHIFDKEFVFPPFPSEIAELAYKIQHTNSVGIHIRHGDFLPLGWCAYPKYYKRCIEYAEQNTPPPRIRILCFFK